MDIACKRINKLTTQFQCNIYESYFVYNHMHVTDIVSKGQLYNRDPQYVNHTTLINGMKQCYRMNSFGTLLCSLSFIYFLIIIPFVMPFVHSHWNKSFDEFNVLLMRATIFSMIVCFVGLIIKLRAHTIGRMSITYKFDEKSASIYESLCLFFDSMSTNHRLWQVSYNTALVLKKGMPYFLKTNIPVFCLKANTKRFYFLPDQILIINSKKISAASYNNFEITLGTTYRTEYDGVKIKDAHVVGETWEHTTKKGLPDKRYAINNKVPICEYGMITIKSNEFPYFNIVCSNSETIDKMRPHVNRIIDTGSRYYNQLEFD